MVEMINIDDEIKQIASKQKVELADFMRREKKLEEEKEKQALEKMKEMLSHENDSLKGLRKSSLESFEVFCKSEIELIHIACEEHKKEVDKVNWKRGTVIKGKRKC